MRRFLRYFVALLICLLGTSAFASSTTDTVVIDVDAGKLLVLSYRVELAQVDKPITIDKDGEGALLRVATTMGDVQLRLGDAPLRITERAYPYIAIAEGAEDAPDADTTATPMPRPRVCTCGAALTDHSCPRCHQPYCQHDDIACGYRLNPVPTPASTVLPDGKKTTSYIDPAGRYQIGPPEGVKSKEWNPSKEYVDAHATPTPTPMYMPTPSPTPRPTSKW